jgi:hypothetical protein
MNRGFLATEVTRSYSIADSIASLAILGHGRFGNQVDVFGGAIWW